MDNDMRMLETSMVPGTSVYNNAHEEIGAVDDLIVDTATGKVRYAILSFGGFLGIGKSQYVGRPVEDVSGPRSAFAP